LFEFLIPGGPDHEPMEGNFHKILVNKLGVPLLHIDNDVFNEGAGYRIFNNVDSTDQEFENFKRIIQEVMNTDTYTPDGLSNA